MLAVCYLGFISLGLPDTLLGIAWPSVRAAFELRQDSIAWLFVGTGSSYFLSSFFAGRLLGLFNVGLLLAGSTALVALGGANYGLATVWPWFAMGSLLHGLGSGAIDAGLNHYAATHFSARHMHWLHASYSFGAMLGPVLMTACIAGAGDWRLAYLIVAAVLAALTLLFLASRSRWLDAPAAAPASSSSGPAEQGDARHEPTSVPQVDAAAAGIRVTAGSALRHPTVQPSIVLFFVYTGLEVALGQWSFTVLTESRGISTQTSGAWVTVYWGAILAGRIGFGFVADRVSLDRLVRVSLATALAGAALFAWNPVPRSAVAALALCGLGLAVVFPCLMSRTPERLGGDLAGHAIGFQVAAAMLGAAAVPSVCGFVAQRAGLGLVAPTLFATAVTLLLVHEVLVSRSRPARV